MTKTKLSPNRVHASATTTCPMSCERDGRAKEDAEMTTYRVTTSDGRDGSEHATQEAAEAEIAQMMGWEECVCSDSFTVGSCEGKRGSVYGVECFASQEECEACQDGDAYAPRIIIIKGDEAWAMGRVDEEEYA